jgi:hypothetical protein
MTDKIKLNDRDEQALREAEDAYAEARQQLEQNYQQRMEVLNSKLQGAIEHVRVAYDVPDDWEFSFDDGEAGFEPPEEGE